ncbi:MAG: rhodanese-related sulfurtransferase [Myxococcota bacterium]|jgi:rhodanese-related sulfurtransferase
MIPEVSPAQAAEWLASGEAMLLDVREVPELGLAAVSGATHISMSTLGARLFELDRGRKIAVMCHHGVRSYRVASYLQQQGFTDVHNVAGGIAAWADQVDATVGRY